MPEIAIQSTVYTYTYRIYYLQKAWVQGYEFTAQYYPSDCSQSCIRGSHGIIIILWTHCSSGEMTIVCTSLVIVTHKNTDDYRHTSSQAWCDSKHLTSAYSGSTVWDSRLAVSPEGVLEEVGQFWEPIRDVLVLHRERERQSTVFQAICEETTICAHNLFYIAQCINAGWTLCTYIVQYRTRSNYLNGQK